MFENTSKEAERLVQRAREENLWIYFAPAKQWFTPEEFEVFAKCLIISNNEKNHMLFINYSLADPKQAIRTRMAYAIKATAEVQEFTERVMAYYNFVGKKSVG